MADTSSWGTVTIQLPDSLTASADVLSDLIGAILAILEVVRQVLEVIKALIIGLLDPINAIVAALIAEVEALLNDLRQIGVYISFDEMNTPFSNLLGGYQAYERRMIARLTDRTDPTRPDFSSATTVVAVFLYASFDSSGIAQAIEFINQVKRFFGVRGKPTSFTTPVGLTATYGASSTGLGAFKSVAEILNEGSAPTRAVLRWQMAPTPGAGSIAWPLPQPSGFLVEVSTIKDGLVLGYNTPAPRSNLDADGVQHQVSGLVFDPEGQPFRLYGGVDVLDTGDLAWSGSGTYSPPSGAGATQLYAFRSAADMSPIPVDALKQGDKYIFQRAFFYDVDSVLGVNLMAPGQGFSFTLDADQMPYGATIEKNSDGSVTVTPDTEVATDVFVRVSALTSSVSTGSDFRPTNFYWSLSQADIAGGLATKLSVGNSLPPAAKGEPSSPLQITFPSQQTSDYINVVATALAVMVLSRSDLAAQGSGASFQLDTAGQATGLEDLARYLTPLVVGPNTSRFFGRPNLDPSSFQSKVLVACRAAANRLLEMTGTPSSSIQQYVLEHAQVTVASGKKLLSEVTWKDLDPDYALDLTILESLDVAVTGAMPVDYDSTKGVLTVAVAPNPQSLVNDPVEIDNLLSSLSVTLDRTPGFLVHSNYPVGGMGTGSCDFSPILFSVWGEDLSMRFCRNIFLDNPDILTISAAVLNIAASPLGKTGVGAWQAYRLFPQGIPPVDAAFSEIMGFLSAIQEGLKGAGDVIVDYINFLEARILELEALLQRIEALLNLVISISVPSASALVVVGTGTDGVLSQFISADNKPSDSGVTTSYIDSTTGQVVKSGAYGCGVVLLAGGLPTSLVELLQLLFSGS